MQCTRHLAPRIARLIGLGLLLLNLLPLTSDPLPVEASFRPVDQGSSFGSAVPCLSGEDRFATTCFADTIFHAAPAGDPAVVEVGTTSRTMLGTLGARSGPRTDARTGAGSLGAVYGLAYDDGAISGTPRLFVAASVKRLTSFGPAGPGGVYVYSFASRQWSTAFTVPGMSWDRTRANDSFDSDSIAQVGRAGLGDMEISPDGRTLFIVNISARRIERYDITGAVPARLAPLAIDVAGAANDPLDPVLAARGLADTAPLRREFIPFALEFSPLGSAEDPLLLVGFTDSATRHVQQGGRAAPTGYPWAHVVSYRMRSNQWHLELSQNLGNLGGTGRMHGSTIAARWASTYPDRGMRDWHPWHDNLANMPRTVVAGLGDTILYPQPLLSDIETSHDGRRMLLGFRDRTGDQVLTADAPPGQFSTIAQGDTLVYDRVGSGWTMVTTSRPADLTNRNPDSDTVTPAASDVLNDNRHFYDPASNPVHIENHMGALATALQSAGQPGAPPAEHIVTTALLGFRQSGLSFYRLGGGDEVAAPNTLITPSKHAGGKSAGLGDLEPLCTYAFVSGRVWQDLNGNGYREDNEPGFAGVTLELYRGSATNPADARAVTDPNGFYRFAVPPNSDFNIRIAAANRQPGGVVYGWRFSPPNRNDDTRDSDASDVWGYIEFAGSLATPSVGITGLAIPTPVRESDEGNFDIGLTQLPPRGQIGDLVWRDDNANGIQDAGEKGLSGIAWDNLSISLVPHPETLATNWPLPTVQKAPNGRYRFAHLPPGRYAVQFANLPPGARIAPFRTGGGLNDTQDSDVPPGGPLLTRFVELRSPPPNGADINLNLDLGLTGSFDLWIEKSGPGRRPLVGERFDYTLSYGNDAPAATSVANVTLVDRLPAGLSYVPGSTMPATLQPGVSGDPASGQTLTWTLSQLAGGQRATLRFSVEVMVSAVRPHAIAAPAQNCASIAAPPAVAALERDQRPNTSCVSTTLLRPNLWVEKAGPTTGAVDELLEYTVILNNGLGQMGIPMPNVRVRDQLPAGVAFVEFTDNDLGCYYEAATHAIEGCRIASLNSWRKFSYRVRVLPTAVDPTSLTGILTNTAELLPPFPVGDSPEDNRASVTTRIANPDIVARPAFQPATGIALEGSPAPVPVGGTITAFLRGQNLTTTGARGVAFTGRLSPGVTLTIGNHPAFCTLLDPDTEGQAGIRCTRDSWRVTTAPDRPRLIDFDRYVSTPFFIITVPPSFPHDTLVYTETVSATLPPPEVGPALLNNTTTITTRVMRPNVYVDVAAINKSAPERGPAGWLSYVRYRVSYGNNVANPDARRSARERARPADRTWPAATTVLSATLPAGTELDRVTDAAGNAVSGYTTSTDAAGRTVLSWQLGTLDPDTSGPAGTLLITVRAQQEPGAELALDATISTATAGDDPVDNQDTDSTGVARLPAPGPADGTIRLAIHSDLDPASRDANDTNAVYLSDDNRIAWPAGEVLDFTPRLTALTMPDPAVADDPLSPYAFYGRIVGWRLLGFALPGATYDAASASDATGRSGCRPGDRIASGDLPGCAYRYPGAGATGRPLAQLLPGGLPQEHEMAGQAHVYWTQPPAPPMRRSDLYLYTLNPLTPVTISIAVDVETWLMNLAPGAPIGDWRMPPIELPGTRQIQSITRTVEVTLLVPRSLVGPGSR